MGRIRAVFFDAGDTLIHRWVPKQERFPWLCRKAAISLPEDPVRIAAGIEAQERFFQDRQKHHDAKTPAWYVRLHREGLVAMGLSGEVNELAEHVYQIEKSLAISYIIDPDAIPLLQSLREEGFRLVVVSNWDGSLLDTIRSSGLAGYFDAILDSTVVGSRKPDVTMFRLACAVTGVLPEEAIHVGDSPESDVVGAFAAGIHPVLLDAVNLFPDGSLHVPATRIRRLSDLFSVLA